jgi:hypothetical protein
LGFTTCTLAEASNPAICHPCTPVPSCFNECTMCDLCLGKSELPPACGGPQSCPSGLQPCGLDSQPPCTAGKYCKTGCCTAAPL